MGTITLAFLCAILVGTPLGPKETWHDIFVVCFTERELDTVEPPEREGPATIGGEKGTPCS